MELETKVKWIKEAEARIATLTEELKNGEEKASRLEERLKMLEAREARYKARLERLKAKETHIRERLEAINTKNYKKVRAIDNDEAYMNRNKEDLFFETLDFVINNPKFVDPDPDNEKLSQATLEAAAEFLRKTSEEPMLQEIADRWSGAFLSDLDEICRRMARL